MGGEGQRSPAADLSGIVFDLTLEEAFSLTAVRSEEDYERLKGRLDELRGVSYAFVNVNRGVHRLVLTTIVGKGEEVTRSVVLDHLGLGVDMEMLKAAVREAEFSFGGNYPISREIEERLKAACASAASPEG